MSRIRKIVVIADGAYDRSGVYETAAKRYSGGGVVVPPRSRAVPSATAQSDPTLRDWHLQAIANGGRMAWQVMSGYNVHALVEAFFSRHKHVIGDGLRFHTASSMIAAGTLTAPSCPCQARSVTGAGEAAAGSAVSSFSTAVEAATLPCSA